MNAWFKMSNTATNSSSFPVMNTASPDAIKILYRAPISSKWLCCVKCLGCPCTLCCWDNIKERTYFFVMENRIEWNAPSLCSASGCWSVLTCKCKPADNVSVLYFDHTTMQNAAKTECCKPAFTHCSCFPTCCELCGECITIYSDGKQVRRLLLSQVVAAARV